MRLPLRSAPLLLLLLGACGPAEPPSCPPERPECAPQPPCLPADDPLDAELRDGLSLSSNFDNGNARLVGLDAQGGALSIEGESIKGAPALWWHFRLEGLTSGQRLTLSAENGKDLGETNAVYSYDRRTWHRFAEDKSPYSETFTASPVWIARNLPYTYRRSLALVCALPRQSPRVSAIDLAISELGLAVKLLRITDPDAAIAGKVMLWVQARVHAWESHGSWVLEGLARWLVGDDPRAAALLRRAVVYLVPVVDVDSVLVGGAGKGQQPVDFNHCWCLERCWKAVGAAVAYIDAEHAKTPLRAFVDLHSPWYNQQSFIYYRNTLSESELGHLEAFTARLAEAAAALPEGNTWSTELRPLASNEGTLTRAANFCAEARWLPPSPAGITLPMEIAHARDPNGRFITIPGLLGYGEALGRALAWHVDGP